MKKKSEKKDEEERGVTQEATPEIDTVIVDEDHDLEIGDHGRILRAEEIDRAIGIAIPIVFEKMRMIRNVLGRNLPPNVISVRSLRNLLLRKFYATSMVMEILPKLYHNPKMKQRLRTKRKM